MGGLSGGDRQTTNLRFHTAQFRFRLLTSCFVFLKMYSTVEIQIAHIVFSLFAADITTGLSKELAANKKYAMGEFY